MNLILKKTSLSNTFTLCLVPYRLYLQVCDRFGTCTSQFGECTRTYGSSAIVKRLEFRSVMLPYIDVQCFLFQNYINYIFGYFDLENIILDDENKEFSG